MKSTGLKKMVGTKAAMVCVTVSVCAGAGVAAAAATDNAPWQDPPVAAERTVPATEAPVTTAVAVTTTSVAAELAGDLEPAVTQPVTAETAAPTTAPTTAPAPDPTEPATTQPVSTEPATSAPATTVRPDTSVPQGIELACTVQGNAVDCSWSGGAVPGFSRFLVLRGDGRVVFMSGDPTAAGYIDQSVPAGSYSYVVVAVDGNSKALVHSNPVFVQIGAAG